MSYTRQEIGSAKLISMYQEYVDLSNQLAEGEIDQLEALDRVDSLGVEDAYGVVWKIDPNSGTFLTISPNGAQEVDADPLAYQPGEDDTSDVTNVDKKWRYAEKPSEAGAIVASPYKKPSLARKLLWGAGGVVGALAIFFAGVSFSSSDEPDPAAAEQESVERPVVEDPGPTPERIRNVLDQLGSGDSSRVGYAVPNSEDAGRMNWATAVLGSLTKTGYSLSETRTEEGVSVLEVRDQRDNVIMSGDLEWEQDSSGNWILSEAPLLAPPGDELPESIESPSQDGEADVEGSDDPAAVEDPEEDTLPEGEPSAEDKPPAEDDPKD